MTRDAIQEALLQQALADGWKIEDDPVRIRMRYKDYDLAEGVPRPIMYLDIGMLAGTIERLERENRLLREALQAYGKSEFQ